jgi:hypothetical protein
LTDVVGWFDAAEKVDDLTTCESEADAGSGEAPGFGKRLQDDEVWVVVEIVGQRRLI